MSKGSFAATVVCAGLTLWSTTAGATPRGKAPSRGKRSTGTLRAPRKPARPALERQASAAWEGGAVSPRREVASNESSQEESRQSTGSLPAEARASKRREPEGADTPSDSGAEERERTGNEEEKRLALDAHPTLVLPVGDFASAAGLGIGAAVQLEYRATPALSVTARTGFVYHLPVDQLGYKLSVHELPLLGGVRYYFAGDNRGVFSFAELGIVHLTARVESDSTKVSQSEVKPGGVIGAGYRVGPVDARGNLVVLNLGAIEKSVALMASVGYAFLEF